MKSLSLISAYILVLAITSPAMCSEPTSAKEASRSSARLITLGTGGGPIMRAKRAQQASLLIVDGHTYLIDCGEGTLRRLAEAGWQPNQIEQVFLTHLHIDHNVELGEIVAFNWQFAGRRKIEIHGPPGTTSMTQAMVRAFAIQEALFDPAMPPHPTMLSLADTREISVSAGTEPHLVFEDERVKVFAVRNSHYKTLKMTPPVYGEPISYSYRFETKKRSFVFTGDTGPSEAVTRLAQGADVLVSEIVDIEKISRFAKAQYKASDEALRAMTAHMVEEHLEPTAVGEMAKAANVKHVVLSHIVPGQDDEENPESYADGVKKIYKGQVSLANDLDEF